MKNNRQNTNIEIVRKQTMQGEFDQTRSFLRQCMAAVVRGDINHQQAKDVALLAQQQNYNMALEMALFGSKPQATKELLQAADRLAGSDSYE